MSRRMTREERSDRIKGLLEGAVVAAVEHGWNDDTIRDWVENYLARARTDKADRA